jgi:hypothetical protein
VRSCEEGSTTNKRGKSGNDPAGVFAVSVVVTLHPMRWIFAVLAVVAPSVARAQRPIDYVEVAPSAANVRRDHLGDVLYLNRCLDGCVVTKGGSSAVLDQSSIIPSSGTLTGFALGDEVWAQVVACVTETYRPYGVHVVEQQPAGSDFVEVMIAGSSNELGGTGDLLGLAPLTTDCSPQTNALAFAFANSHPRPDPLDICATAAHEAGHVYGLDHAYECKDPMTYLTSCGQKFFLNLELPCGEFDGPRACKCSATQDSHRQLLDVLGEGLPSDPPAVNIPYPTTGTSIPGGINVFVEIASPRPVIRLELWVNGDRWGEVAGAITQTIYMLPLDVAVPDGLLDLEVRAVNDLGVIGSATVSVLKGQACASAESCLAGQECTAGKCAFPPGAVALGELCDDQWQCATQQCEPLHDELRCTQDCLAGLPEAGCADEFACVAASSPTSGYCWPADLVDVEGGGCCHSGRQTPPVALMVLVALGLSRGRRGAVRATR